jgi:hypothetical protein
MYPTTPLHDSEHLRLYLNALYLVNTYVFKWIIGFMTSYHSDKIFPGTNQGTNPSILATI